MLSNIRQRNFLQRKQKKNPTSKRISVLQIVQTITRENEPSIRVSS